MPYDTDMGSYFVKIPVPAYPFFSVEQFQYDLNLYLSWNVLFKFRDFTKSSSILVSLKQIKSGSSAFIKVSNSFFFNNGLKPLTFQ